jgi:dinuclear metal center YbgI/SA1388 family protein
MSYQITHISDFFNSWAPFSTQAEYDNSGLLVGSLNNPITGILTTLDVTEEVVEEAINSQCNLIVAHHPLIFRKLSRINPDTTVGSILYKLIRNDISVLAVHTNLDAAQNGVSFALANQLQLQNQQFLSHHDETMTHGYGVVGTLKSSMSSTDFLEYVCLQLDTTALRFSGSTSLISTVAVCGGSGISLASQAVRRQADAFITSDIKYHEYFEHPELLKIDAGHYETEIFVSAHISDQLKKQFSDLHVATSRVRTNPMNIHHSSTPFSKSTT